MSLKQFPVSLGNRTFSPKDQVRHLRGYKPGSLKTRDWTLALKEAHKQGAVGVCLCLEVQQDKRRLAVRKSPNGLFHLARYPGTEKEHSPYCAYSKTDKQRPGAQTQEVTDPPATERELDRNVQKDHFSPEAMSELAGPQQTNSAYNVICSLDQYGNKQGKPRQMNFAQLLPALWAHARLTLHTGQPSMGPGQVAGTLSRAAQSFVINDAPLGPQLLLYSSEHYEKRTGRNRQVVERCIANDSEIWMLSFLSRYCTDKHTRPRTFPVSGYHGLPFFTIREQRWNELLDSHPVATSAWRHGYRVAALVRAELKANPSSPSKVRASVTDATLMVVTNCMVPVFTAAEHVLAGRLCSEKRSFRKTLPEDGPTARYGAYSPTFVLTDTGNRETPLVLFDSADSPERAQEKHAFFTNLYQRPGSWWHWSQGQSLSKPLPLPGEGSGVAP